jgi:hypothetical protein
MRLHDPRMAADLLADSTPPGDAGDDVTLAQIPSNVRVVAVVPVRFTRPPPSASTEAVDALDRVDQGQSRAAVVEVGGGQQRSRRGLRRAGLFTWGPLYEEGIAVAK